MNNHVNTLANCLRVATVRKQSLRTYWFARYDDASSDHNLRIIMQHACIATKVISALFACVMIWVCKVSSDFYALYLSSYIYSEQLTNRYLIVRLLVSSALTWERAQRKCCLLCLELIENVKGIRLQLTYNELVESSSYTRRILAKTR